MKQNLVTESNLQEALSKIGVIPNQVLDISAESNIADEKPILLAKKLAEHKAAKLLKNYKGDGIFIASSKIVALGNRILPIAVNDERIRENLQKISGKRHKVYVSVCFIKREGDNLIKKNKTVTSILKIKRLTDAEIENYIQNKQGLNIPGGYDLKGLANSFVIFFSGSLAAIDGLPLYETRNMLLSLGLKLE